MSLKKSGNRFRNTNRIRYMVATGMLSALATVFMMLDFSIPMLIPGFVKMDFSELPALIAAFSMGPLSGAAVCLIKNLIHFGVASSTGGIGELGNFLMGITFVVPAGVMYRWKKQRKTAVLASVLGALIMAACSVPINYFITYPIYSKMMPLDVIIGMYQELISGVNGLLQCLLIFNMPFTFLKGMCDAVITFLIYKRISPWIHGKK